MTLPYCIVLKNSKIHEINSLLIVKMGCTTEKRIIMNWDSVPPQSYILIFHK